MARHAHLFQCTECRWWNKPMLSDKLHGNYTVKCGHCGHYHYRVIKEGVVTGDRHSHAVSKQGGKEIGDIIHVPASACTEKKPQIGTMANIRQLEAAGLST